MNDWYKGYLCGMAMYAVLDALIEPIVKRIFKKEADKQYLIAENERLISENDLLRKAVEASLEHFESGFTAEYRVVEACKAALHGGSTNPPDQA